MVFSHKIAAMLSCFVFLCLFQRFKTRENGVFKVTVDRVRTLFSVKLSIYGQPNRQIVANNTGFGRQNIEPTMLKETASLPFFGKHTKTVLVTFFWKTCSNFKGKNGTESDF